MNVTIIPVVIGDFGSYRGIIKGTGGLGGRRRVKTIQTKNIIESGQNTEQNPGVLRRLAVTPVKDHQLKLM